MAAISWKNPVNGDWNVAGNWSTNTVPTLADAVTISVAGPYIVTISSADVANLLTFNALSGRADRKRGFVDHGGGAHCRFRLGVSQQGEHDRECGVGGRRARVRQWRRAGSRLGHRERRRTARDHERDPQQRAQLLGDFDHRGRAWNDAHRNRVCQHRRECNAELRRARTGWRRPLELRAATQSPPLSPSTLSPARSRPGAAWLPR